MAPESAQHEFILARHKKSSIFFPPNVSFCRKTQTVGNSMPSNHSKGDVVEQPSARVIERDGDGSPQLILSTPSMQTNQHGKLCIRHLSAVEFYAKTVEPRRLLTAILCTIFACTFLPRTPDLWWIIFSLSFLASAAAYVFHALVQRPAPVLLMDSRDTFPRTLSRYLAGFVTPSRTVLSHGTLQVELALPAYFQADQDKSAETNAWTIVLELTMAAENKHERAATWQTWRMSWWTIDMDKNPPTAAEVHRAFRDAAASLRTLSEFRFGDSSWFENKQVLSATYVPASSYENYFCPLDHPLWKVLRNESETTWIHWEGPPGTGKTSGALYLAAKLISTSAVVLVSHSEIKDFCKRGDGRNFFFAQLRSEVLGKMSTGEDVLVIIDEAQVVLEVDSGTEKENNGGVVAAPSTDGKCGAPAHGTYVNPEFEELVLDLFNILRGRAVLVTLTNDPLGHLEFSHRLRSRLSRHLVPTSDGQSQPEVARKMSKEEIYHIVTARYALQHTEAMSITQELLCNNSIRLITARDITKRVSLPQH